MSNPAAPVAQRLLAGRHLSVLNAALRQWPAAVETYATTIELLPLLTWHGLSRASSDRQLIVWSWHTVDAAGHAIAVGQPARAVEFLEAGRGLRWSQLLATRADLTAVGEVEPALARRLEQVRKALDGPRVA